MVLYKSQLSKLNPKHCTLNLFLNFYQSNILLNVVSSFFNFCTTASFNIYLDAQAESATHAVISGVIAQDHTVDGKTFIAGGPLLCPAQDIGVVPVTKEFALVAECTEGQGVYTSYDGSKYVAHIIPETGKLIQKRRERVQSRIWKALHLTLLLILPLSNLLH